MKMENVGLNLPSISKQDHLLVRLSTYPLILDNKISELSLTRISEEQDWRSVTPGSG